MSDHSDPSEAPENSPDREPQAPEFSQEQPRENRDPRPPRYPEQSGRGDRNSRPYGSDRRPPRDGARSGPSRPPYGFGGDRNSRPRRDNPDPRGPRRRDDRPSYNDRQDRQPPRDERWSNNAPNRPQQQYDPRTAREIAAHVLLQVFAGPVDDAAQAVHQASDRARLGDADRRLAFQLTHLVLRHADFLDQFYYRYFNEPPDRLRFESRIVLRLAVVQKHLLDRIPDHAIGDESVRLAREFFRLPGGEVAFINAIVRKIASAGLNPPELEDLDRPVDRFSDRGVAPLAEAARRSSCPPWIVEIYGECIGASQWSELPYLINGEAPVVIRANRLRTSGSKLAEELDRDGIQTRPGELLPDALALQDSGDLPKLIRHPAFADGRLYIQDEASQLVAHIACPQPGERILDLCAAPGGKATHLAELADGRAEITATDVSPRRFPLLEENLHRLGTSGLQALPWDQVVQRRSDDREESSPARNDYDNRSNESPAQKGSDHPAPGWESSQDLVLLDAPCSGLGTLRRHPEIRHRLRPEDLKRLSRNQLRLLRLAAEFVKPGGRLVYSTCTMTPMENLRVVETFLRSNRQWVVEGAPEGLSPAVRRLRHSDGFYRTWPSYLDLDGFEMVILRLRTGPTPSLALRNL